MHSHVMQSVDTQIDQVFGRIGNRVRCSIFLFLCCFLPFHRYFIAAPFECRSCIELPLNLQAIEILQRKQNMNENWLVFVASFGHSYVYQIEQDFST